MAIIHFQYLSVYKINNLKNYPVILNWHFKILTGIPNFVFRCRWVRNWAWWSYFRDYFPVKLVRREECAMDPKRNYLMCAFPHGLVCTGAYACFSTDACGWEEKFSGFTPYMLTLDTHFSKPFFRDFALSLGKWILPFFLLVKRQFSYLK